MAVAALVGCKEEGQTLYVGTYGDAIHILNYNPSTGELAESGTIPAEDASYIAFGEDNADGGKVLYAVSERGDDSGAYSFAESPEGWRLTAHSHETGADPCFIFPVPGTGKVITADYSGGDFSVFDTEDGVLTGRIQNDIFPGAHIHQTRELPTSMAEGAEGRYILVSDLGNSLIRVNKLTGEEPFMVQTDSLQCGEGAGPRHMEFNESASLLYCLTELSGEVIVWKVSTHDGKPSFSQVQRVMADGYDAHGSGDIHLHPSGKWLYTSHRLQGDGISVLKVGEDGLLEKIGYTPTQSHPRNFTFSPDGRRILVACRDTNSIQVFDIDPETGLLSECRHTFTTGSDKPVCLIFR